MDKYLVIGNPIAHSKSPDIHRMFAEQTKQAISYEKQLVEVDTLKQKILAFKQAGYKGVNITAPFKEQVMQLCDKLSERAQAAAAVNTLWFKGDGTLYGDNTDGAGLVGDLLRSGIELSGARVLIIGAGGATRGVVQPLMAQNVSSVTIANRTESKAHSLVADFNAHNIRASDLKKISGQQFDVIINATSAGLSAGRPDIDASIVSGAVCYDMNYNKAITLFNQWALDNGATQVIDGLGMLVGQAAESFKLWRGVMPDVASVVTEIRNQMVASA